MEMETPKRLRGRLEVMFDDGRRPDALDAACKIEQVVQLSRIAFRLIDLENQLVTIGEILEDKQR